mgnify:CR=1 FL=1
MTDVAVQRTILHATTVAFGGRGLLILGPSGAGKSGLALQLMALGARLVADDRTELARHGTALVARAPAAIRGRIEARGIGLLAAPALDRAMLSAALDLARDESERLPPFRNVTFLGVTLQLVLGQRSPYFPAALRHYMLHGRTA